MQLIPCPFCGPRAEIEFAYGCAAEAAPGATRRSDRKDLDRIFNRKNPRGVHVELWQHVSGCRSWINLERNTLTHEIVGCRPARKVKS
jgi:heterotetrameric sarcosine oxidase delta subunit